MLRKQTATESDQVLELTGQSRGIQCIKELRDGRIACSTVNGKLSLWDLQTGEKKELNGYDQWNPWVSSIQELSNGHLLTGYGKTLQIWNVTTCECIQTIELEFASSSLLVLRDGRVIVGGHDGRLALFTFALVKEPQLVLESSVKMAL